LERYVVLIYHRDPTDPKKIFGAVERGWGQRRAGFLNSDALVNILAQRRRVPEEKSEIPAKSGTGDDFQSVSEMMESIRMELEGPEF
jgi:hypothetical protein